MVAQVITIVNKSGKIVSTSKHLVNVFTEAKSAYNERKAEIRAVRKTEEAAKENERKAQKQLAALALDDQDDRISHRSSRRGSEDGRSVARRKPVSSRSKDRPPFERGDSDSFYANDRPRRSSHRPSPLRHDSFAEDDPRAGELMRRNTEGMQLGRRHSEAPQRRRGSADDIDMDLAYGELPPPMPESKVEDQIELRTKMNYLQRLLDEGNCMQHSVTSIVDNLQKNPDALAAVALTLAEISNLAMKMAPGALATLKGSFPAIIALLASPQFAIAAGVGVGVTIIAFGGYKIIKKLKAKNEENRLLEPGFQVETPQEPEIPMEEETDDLRQLDRIERWRRGIADEQAASLGASVEGEFLTPAATRTMIEEGRLTEADFLPLPPKSEKSKHRKKKTARSEVSSASKTSKSSKVKVSSKKEPSILKSLFKGTSERKEKVRQFA